MSSSFDTFSNDGEEAARGSTRPFDDDGYLGYDPRLPSQRYESYSTFAADEDSKDPISDDILPAGDIPVQHHYTSGEGSLPASPEGYGSFRADPHPGFSSAPSPFSMPESNGKAYGEEEDGGIFTSDGPILPPPSEMQSEEGFILREWRRDLLKNLKRHKDEDALKGQAVKNQRALWNKTLEFRFLLQKAFSSSNRLPQEPVRSTFCNSDNVVAQAYSDLISSSKQTLNCMLELQEALLEKNPAIVQVIDGNSKGSCKDEGLSDDLKGENDEDWSQIHRMYCRIAPFRNISVDKWQRKTQVTTGQVALKHKLHAFNQNISEQVAGYMRDPSRMIKSMQLKRSSVGIFSKVAGDSQIKDSPSIKEQDENAVGDPELLDDSEFYQQLLKEFFESCDLTSSEASFYALRRLQPKKRKIVDRRSSKSRKIRYNVHEPIANFSAPIPGVYPPMADKLIANLFGRGNQKSTPTM